MKKCEKKFLSNLASGATGSIILVLNLRSRKVYNEKKISKELEMFTVIEHKRYT